MFFVIAHPRNNEAPGAHHARLKVYVIPRAIIGRGGTIGRQPAPFRQYVPTRFRNQPLWS